MRPQPLLGLGGGGRVAGDRAGGQRVRAEVEPVAAGDRVLPPHDPVGHPGKHRCGRPVELGLGGPVEDHVRSALAKQRGEPQDRRGDAVELAHAPGLDDLDAQPGRAQLGRPGAVLEEHELDLVPAVVVASEHRVQHGLGAAEALPPGNRDDDAHGGSVRHVESQRRAHRLDNTAPRRRRRRTPRAQNSRREGVHEGDRSRGRDVIDRARATVDSPACRSESQIAASMWHSPTITCW